MTENSSEKYSNLPLPISDVNNQARLASKIQTILPASHERTPRPSENKSQTPVIPGNLSLHDTQKLENLESMLDRYDNLGSVSTADISKEIAHLSAKKEGYSLAEQRFAPDSVRMNLDPIGITETGYPIYPWISGQKGRELRDEGVIMKQPEWLKKMAKKNKKIRTKNAM